jgi:hypothetical protein
MVTRAINQAATMATLRLAGLAVLEEMESDYIRFRANSIHTIDEAMDAANEMTELWGIQITVAV